MPDDRSTPSPVVLGLDLGTSSCKVCARQLDGQIVATATAAYPTHTPQPGWAEQDPADWLTAVATAIGKLQLAGRDVRAIALTSAAHIGVLLDENDRVIRHAILWNDQRAKTQAVELNDRFGSALLDQTANAASPGWTLAQFQWVKETEPDAWRRVRSVLLSKDYLAWWLTGERVTDPATAVSAQLYDVRDTRWSDTFCSELDLPTTALPALRAVKEVVGHLRAEPAAALGLRAGTPIINGTLDSATELLAVGCRKAGDGMIRLATAGGLQVVTAAPAPHARRITYPHPIKPFWYSQAGTNTCAAAVEWVIRLVADGLSHTEIEQLARQAPPGCDGLLFHPYLAGERAPHWNADLRASFTGMALHHSRAHLLRAAFEGTALSIHDAMRTLADIPLSADVISVAGGGARNALWVQTLADVLDRPLRPMPDDDSAAGAAIIALESLSAEPSPSAEPSSEIVHPQPHLAPRFADAFERYCAFTSK